MEKKISNVGKNVKRIEENPVSKPFGCCSVLFTPHVENEITMQNLYPSKLKAKPAIWTVPERDAIRKDKYT